MNVTDTDSEIDRAAAPISSRGTPIRRQERVTGSEALEVYQSVIDEMTEANTSGNFNHWVELFTFPHWVHLEDIDKVETQPEAIRPFFDMVSALLRDMQVDRMVRAVDDADFLAPGLIRGYHMCYFFRRGREVVEPVASRLRLRLIEGRWRITAVSNSLRNNRIPYDYPEFGDGLPPESVIRDRMGLNDL